MIEPFIPMIIVGGVVVSMLIGVFTDEQRKLKKKLKLAPHRAIRHLPERQFVRFVGKVIGDMPLRAPLSGRPCAAWRVTVKEKRGKSYSELFVRHQASDFRIADGTGTLLVRMEGAELALVSDSHFRSGMLKDATEQLERFLAEQGQKSTGFFFNRDLQYHEAVVELGEWVAVAGFASAEPDPEPDPQRIIGHRETPMRMVLRSSIHDKVIVSDDPRLAVSPRS